LVELFDKPDKIRAAEPTIELIDAR